MWWRFVTTHPSIVQDKHRVHTPQRCRSVGDDDGGPAFPTTVIGWMKQPVDRALDKPQREALERRRSN